MYNSIKICSLIFLGILISLYFLSCKKNDTSENQANNVPDDIGTGVIPLTADEKNSLRFVSSVEDVKNIVEDSLGVVAYSKPASNEYTLPNFTPVGDQGKADNCVVWSSVYEAFSYQLSLITSKPVVDNLQSPDYAYFKMLENKNIKCDSSFHGFNFSDMVNYLTKTGTVSISLWPIQKAPSSKCYNTSYSISDQKFSSRILANDVYFIKNDLSSGDISKMLDIIKYLLNKNIPVLFGIKVNKNILQLKKGKLFDETTNIGDAIGNHAMVVIGFDDDKQAFKIQNSWGTSWGDGGTSFIPYLYFFTTAYDMAFISITRPSQELKNNTLFYSNVNSKQMISSGGPNNEFGGLATGVEIKEYSGLSLAKFTRENHSRIEYNLNNVIPNFPDQIPAKGTFEMYVFITNSYTYRNYQLTDNDGRVCLLTTDNGGLDTHWPGSMRLFASKAGDIEFTINTTKYSTLDPYTLLATNTKFRYNEWHRIGISYGDLGMSIMVDGLTVASNSNFKMNITNGGGHVLQNDRPTIGEAFSYFPWGLNQWAYGFEGYLYKVRTSTTEKNFSLRI